LQLVHLRNMASNETREQHVSEITRRLKAIALQLNIAMATASQLNEEGKLRESRAIGMHSDHVWIIRHGDESFVTVDKNRDGERGAAIPVLMQGAFSQFLPRDERETQTTNKK
jgi:replicative DNA helicase